VVSDAAQMSPIELKYSNVVTIAEAGCARRNLLEGATWLGQRIRDNR
jgi:hypothetical protein